MGTRRLDNPSRLPLAPSAPGECSPGQEPGGSLSERGRPVRPALPDLVGTKEVARHLGVSERTVKRFVARGELPCFRIGGQIRFDLADVLRFVTARKE